MTPTFKTPDLKRHRFQFSAKLAIPITLVLALILIISSALDIISSRRELSHILEEQSKALITSLEAGSENAIASYDLVQAVVAERLLDNARLLEVLDSRNELDDALLETIAEQNQIFRINVFDSLGQKVMASFSGRGFGSQSAPPALMQAIQDEQNDELVMGFRSSRFGTADRFAVAKRRRKGGVILLNVDAQNMLAFRKSIGLGKLIQDIGQNQGIQFIVLQNENAILSATQNVDSMSTIQSDPLLTQTLSTGNQQNRFIDYRGNPTFEIVHLFDENSGELLRIGLSASHLQEAQHSAVTRAILSSILLLIVGGVAANWLVSGQNVKELQKAYNRIETYTGRMLENMTDAVVAVDGLGDLTLVNSAAESLFRLQGNSVLGKPCSQEIPSICNYLEQGLSSTQNAIYHEEQLEINSKRIIANINVNVIRHTTGSIDVVFAVIKNITEQKRLEENLKRRDQISAMGQLASGVAHEIRNPLNAIGMIAQRFKTEFTPTADHAEYNQLAATMTRETRRINAIVQQFLEFARPAELQYRPTDVKAILSDVATLLHSVAHEKEVKVITECDDLPLIQADPDKLKQVFLNLGQNAVDACSPQDSVLLRCERAQNDIRIIIQDRGQGIPPHELSKIFNLYFTTKENGTGIGLSIVQQIISQHNGAIDVQSAVNQGSIFTITLPVDN